MRIWKALLTHMYWKVELWEGNEPISMRFWSTCWKEKLYTLKPSPTGSKLRKPGKVDWENLWSTLINKDEERTMKREKAYYIDNISYHLLEISMCQNIILNALYALTLFNPYKNLWYTSFSYAFYRWECWGIQKVSWLVQRHWHRQHLNPDTLASEPNALTTVWFCLWCIISDSESLDLIDKEIGRSLVFKAMNYRQRPNKHADTRSHIIDKSAFIVWKPVLQSMKQALALFSNDEIGVSKSSIWPSCTLMDTQRSIGILDRGA